MKKTLLALFMSSTLWLSGCVTRIEGRVVNIKVQPETELQVKGLPLPGL